MGDLAQNLTLLLARGDAATLGLVWLGGVLTSLSPCTLAMLPVLVGYVGGFEPVNRRQGFGLSAFFVLGLATTYAVLGMIAVLFGQLFGRVGPLWPYLMGAVALVMGLNLIGVVHFRFPTLQHVPAVRSGHLGAFLLGLAFGLTSSPCTTPVLAVLVTYVSGQGRLGFGSLLLFVYGLGNGLPLLLAGTSTALLRHLPALREQGHLITTGSGWVLVGYGLYLIVRTGF